ncbi:hypothetical protein C1I97_21655 [Streptomyces sp. NTH33]|uniref:hypothetical protein n=1 Tax=Streptomyces sp. NTH33 TaxID=1735453 RepID=UPI000DA829F7|nr:hypothetical protein [Streptomyces sp. NTH33]PZH02178.1 hypothetical protein C1I97_21655 [Streptomyces sp. NTH33]
MSAPRPGRRGAALTIALLLTTTAACGGAPGRAHEGSGPADTSEAALTYGTGPVRDPSVTYQPDVVMVEGGPRAIRAASGDGLTWTIDGNARGAQDVRPGKVLYATSRAVGRVQEVRRVHRDVVATLGPVEFTEVFRDAHLTLDQDIDDGALHYLEIPDLPGAVTVPADAPTGVVTEAGKGVVTEAGKDAAREAGKDATRDVPTTARTIGRTSVRAAHSGRVGTVVARGPVRLAATAGGTLPPARSSSVTADLGEWKAQPYRTPGAFGLKFDHKAAAGLKVFVDFSLRTEKLHIRSDVPISGGRVADGATFAVEGIKSVAISIAAGAANGVIDNSKIRAEVPVQMTLPIAGTPFAFDISWKFSVATALGGNNTTVTAGGEWGLDGAIDMVNGSIVTPKLSVIKSIMDSITGISVGVSDIATAIEFKVQVGVGVPAAFAGPYAKLVMDFGVTNGSALGAPLTRCVGATLDGKVGGGVGVSVSAVAMAALKKLLPTMKFQLHQEALTPFVHRQQTLPDVPLCKS